MMLLYVGPWTVRFMLASARSLLPKATPSGAKPCTAGKLRKNWASAKSTVPATWSERASRVREALRENRVSVAGASDAVQRAYMSARTSLPSLVHLLSCLKRCSL